MSEVKKTYLHVVYAAFGDASILEFQSDDKSRFYLVDGGPIRYVGAGGTQEERVKKLTKLQLSRPYYQYLLYSLTRLAKIPNSTGIKLDGAVVTHPHADHLDGVERLFRELLPHQYQDSVKSDSPDKRLMCNGPVLLTRKFAQENQAYRSFSEFLLTAKFEISLAEDDILNAFGNDIVFSFPSSPGVLYQRHKPSAEDEPFSEDKQRNKLKGGTEDDDLNKSSVILYTEKGGKICLSGDAYGYDITAMLRKHGVKDLDIFKLPHHGSPKNSILGTVLPPPWAFQNLASMLLLSISLNIKCSFDQSPEEESDIDDLCQQLRGIAGDGNGNGEMVQQVAEAFLNVLKARLKNLKGESTPEVLFSKIQDKHISAVQQQSGQADPCENLKPLKPLEDWGTLANNVADSLVGPRFPTTAHSERPTKVRKLDMSTFVGDLLGNSTIYRDFFIAKIGIEKFFESFDCKTYYVSANSRYGHPSADVTKGIIKAAVKKNKPCKIVFTSGGAVPSDHLPDVQHKHYKDWNKLVSLYYLKNDVSFKLDPSSDPNVAPTGTAKFENDDKERIDIAAQLKKNYGFTIPRRSFLPTLDKYYVKTTISQKFHWLRIKPDGTLFLSPAKSQQNGLVVSNAPSINGDLRMITLKSESNDGGQRSVWLEKAKGGGFLVKASADGDYLFEENGALKSSNKKNKAIAFVFDHSTFSGQMHSGKEVSIVEFLKSFGCLGDEQSISVRILLEMLLGISNMKRLTDDLPNDFIGIAALDHRVNMSLSTVELSSSLDGAVVSGHIEVMVEAPASLTFDSHKVTKLDLVVSEPCSTSPGFSLVISTSLPDISYTVDLSGHLKSREPTVDMFLNALGGVPLEGRDNMTLGTLLTRIIGRLPLEALSNCFQAQLLAREIFTWKVDRVLSTVNYFKSPVAVEVLSGDLYVNIPPKMNRLAIGDTVTADLSRIHVMVNDARTYKSCFVIECDASIGSIPVNVKMTSTLASLPEVIIAFPESVSEATVFQTLGLPTTLHNFKVPLVNEVMKNLVLTKPRMSVVQDVRGSIMSRISSVSFDFSFDKFPSVLPSSLPLPQDTRALVSIFNPLSPKFQVGVEVEFKLPVSSASSKDDSLLNAKFSLWPVEVSDQQSEADYGCSISLWPSVSRISILSALQAVGLGELTASLASSFPCISSMLTGVLLNEVTLEANPRTRTVESLTLSIFVPEFSIVEGKLSMYDARLLIQYGDNQWYAETEMKLLVFNKFVCRAEFALPRQDVPGSLTFQNTETSLTLGEFLKGIGVAAEDDLPIIKEALDVQVTKVSITCENDGTSFKLTKFVTVLQKRTLTVGRIKLYNLELEVCFANIQAHASVSFSIQGYLNPKTHGSLAYDAETRELTGRYVFMENISTEECIDDLFNNEMKDFSSSNVFHQVKSLHVQEVKVVLSFPQEEDWCLKQFVLSMEGSLSLGPFNLKRLHLEYIKDQADDAKRHISVVGHFKSDDEALSFSMELSITGQQSESTLFEAAIRPDKPGGVTLSSLLQLIGLKKPEVPDVGGSTDFLNIEMKEAFLQFEISPFRIRKADVVINTTKTLKILEKPVIEVHEARLEYHFDDTDGSAKTEAFIAAVFIIAKCRLDVILRKDTKRGLVVEGQLQDAGGLDFEQAAKQLSPDVPFSLPKNVALTSFLFRLIRSEEMLSLKLEGASHSNWSIDAGFSTITVTTLGGKLNFEKNRISDTWTGSVCLTGKVRLLETVDVAVIVYHDSKGETLASGTVQEPENIDLQVMTQKFAGDSDSSKSWNELVPTETKFSVRSPKFNSASLFINFSTKTLMFYGSVKGFGTGLFMVKKADGKEASAEYGFLFGLNLGSDFRFSNINKGLSVVDEILSVQNANLSVISMEQVTVEEMCEDFSRLKRLEQQPEEVDVPFTDLDIHTISKVEVKRGVTAFAKVTFPGRKSKLLSNLTQIQRGERLAEIVLFAHIADKGSDTVFMAQIKEMKLFGGNLKFDEITLTYQPSRGKTFTLSGKMSLTLTEDSNPIVFLGNLEVSQTKADFSMAIGGNPGKILEPFGMFGISFQDPQLQLSWNFDEDEHRTVVPFCSISGTVNFFKSAAESEPVTTLKGRIMFQEGKPVVASVALNLNHSLSIDDLFVTLFKEQWPSGYLDISFKKGEIYYAKEEVEVDEKTYKEGFQGQTEIQIFGHAFGVELSVDRRGIAVRGYTKFEIDLVIATLTGKNFVQNRGPEIEISRYDRNTKFELSTGVKLLQENLGSCLVGYNVQQKCFLGEVTYNGELLGVGNPSIEFEWSQKSGFKIRKWPVILDLLDLINFAKAFEELSQMIDSPCEKLVGLAFDAVIKTKCKLDVTQVSVKDSGHPDAWFALRLQGKLDIMIITDTPAVTVDFPEMVVAITKPPKQFRMSDLPGFLISEIGKNSIEIARQVFTQPKQLTKFMAALGSIKLSRKVLSGLICRGAHSPNLTSQAASELNSMEKGASDAEEALDKASNALSETAKGAASIAELAAGAVEVLAQVGVVVGALAAIITFIAGIISFFTGKSKEKKEAEKRSEEAKRKGKEARQLVEDRLVMSGLSIALARPGEVEVTWKSLGENVKYSVKLTRTDLSGVETVLLEETTQTNKVSFKGDEVLYNTKTFAAHAYASFECGNETFVGKEKSLFKSVTSHLRAPSKVEVESSQQGREVHVTFSRVEYAVDYKAEVLTHDDKVIGTAIIKLPPKDKDGTYVFHADELTAGVPGKTRVRVCARGQDQTLNEFKYSNDLYLVEAPGDLCHSYEPLSKQLVVKWKVKDTRDISGFQCEIQSIDAKTVVFTREVAKDDSLETNLIIHLSEISDRTKSPYILRVRSLGVSAALASTFIDSNGNLSFLPQVAGITPVYDPQSNQLTVSWMPVNGATNYQVSLRDKTNKSSVVETVTSTGKKNKVVLDMEKVQLKTGVKYVVTVAAGGSDALHLPGEPSTADEEFSQLQKPGSVTQDYSFDEKQIKVTFQPVSRALTHLVEVFNESTPSDIAGKYVVSKPASSVDWPSTVTYCFDVLKMSFDGDRFKSRVTAQGNSKWINSAPCVSPTALKFSDAPLMASLTYNSTSSKLLAIITSRPGTFTVKVEKTSHDSKLVSTVSTQQFELPRDIGSESVRETTLEIPITLDEKSQGAIYQASVQNIGDHHELPSKVTQSNKVTVLDPPEYVKQEYNGDTFTVVWKSVISAYGYKVRVYNTKTESTASEVSVLSHDADFAEEQMKKEFDVRSLSLESDGLYEAVVTVLGSEVSIGGAKTKSKTTIPSCPSPDEVTITFNNETRRMVVSCSSVKDAMSFKLGVADANKLKKQKENIQEALIKFKEVPVNDDGKPIEAEFDDSVLIPPLDGLHCGVAQVMKTQGNNYLPSGYSLSESAIPWLKDAEPIHLTFDPVNSTLKITWAQVNHACQYLVEIIQTRKGVLHPTTLKPFSDKVPVDVLSLDVNMEKLNAEETDKFIAKVQPSGIPGTVIALDATGYSIETLTCEISPKEVHVRQVLNTAVIVTWEGDHLQKFQMSVWRNQEKVFTLHTDQPVVQSTSEALRMVLPGRYTIGVRTQGSANKLHSVYRDADFFIIIMEAPSISSAGQGSAVMVRWKPVDIPGQDFSNYNISYLQPDTEKEWNHVVVEMSKTEKTIMGLQPDSKYLFCISVEDRERGPGILSPATAFHTDFDERMPGNLLDNPNFTTQFKVIRPGGSGGRTRPLIRRPGDQSSSHEWPGDLEGRTRPTTRRPEDEGSSHEFITTPGRKEPGDLEGGTRLVTRRPDDESSSREFITTPGRKEPGGLEGGTRLVTRRLGDQSSSREWPGHLGGRTRPLTTRPDDESSSRERITIPVTTSPGDLGEGSRRVIKRPDEQGCTYDIITAPWKIIKPTDKQYRLEYTPQGTDDLPVLGETSPWCIAAPGNPQSSAWRFQIVDLFSKGISPEYLDDVRPAIEVGEWFAVRRGGAGRYDIKVSLLDSDQRELPGRSYYGDNRKIPQGNGMWDRLEHTFTKYSSGLRFIRFEDAIQGLSWNGQPYDVKAFGATVKFAESPSERGKDYSQECEEAVNKQIQLELDAGNAFRAMSCSKFDDTFIAEIAAERSFKQLLYDQSDLCLTHAQMLEQYQRDRGGHIELQDIQKPESDQWGTELKACDYALFMAREIKLSLTRLRRLANNDGDRHLVEFISDKLLQAQVQFVYAFSDFYNKLKRAVGEAQGY